MPKAFSSMLKRDRSVEKATMRILYKLNERLKYYDEVTFRCIHGGKNFKSRGTGERESIYLSIYLPFSHLG